MSAARFWRRSANVVRGEVDLELPGVSVLLRPSFSALVAAERELGSLAALLERAGAGDVRLSDAASLFWHCSNWEGERAGFESLLAEVGLARILPVYRGLLVRIFAGQ